MRAFVALAAALMGVSSIAVARFERSEPAPAGAAPQAAPAVLDAALQEAPPSATPAESPVPESGPGYRIVGADGGVFTHGWVGFAGSAAGESPSAAVGIAHAAGDEGYWVASADGGVFAFGSAPFHGSAAGVGAGRMVDIAATPGGGGYWLVGSDGGVFAFGDAGYFGSGPEVGLAPRIISISPSPTGQGYWLVSSDGGVFTFGDAVYFGSLGDRVVNGSITDLVPTPSGLGYYLVGSDGGVFTFGDAVFHGAAIGERLTRPIVGMAPYPSGSGYWLLSADGGVFSYGDAPFLGAPVAERTGRRFAAIAAGVGRRQPPPPADPPAEAPADDTAASGEPVAAGAEAPEAGQGASDTAPRGMVEARGRGRTPATATAPVGDDRRVDHEFGWDISYPQCGGPRPAGPATYAIIGVNGGRAFRHNRCLGEQWRWARDASMAAGIYLNVNFPQTPPELAAGASSDRQPDCAPGALSCVAYNFGLNAVRDALAYARSQGVEAPFAWLDVEQLNYWYPSPPFNAVVLRGAIDGVREAGMEPGIYSTPYQYRKIMGDEQPQVPVWTAGAPNAESVAAYCVERGFGGGPAVLVQLLPGQFDPNIACPGGGPLAHYFNVG